MSDETAPLVGAFHRPPAKAILQVLPGGAALRLECEPTNQYDPNAIKVLVAVSEIPPDQHETLKLLAAGYGWDIDDILAQEEWQLGYIAAKRAMDLCWRVEKIAASTLSFDSAGKPLVDITWAP